LFLGKILKRDLKIIAIYLDGENLNSDPALVSSISASCEKILERNMKVNQYSFRFLEHELSSK